jgi:phenylacetate-CoA ligase
MVNIRGVNVYPVGIEAVVRRHADVAEFRSVVSQAGSMRAIRVEIEVMPETGDPGATADRIAYALREALGLKVEVRVVAVGALPRFEMKASRFGVEG